MALFWYLILDFPVRLKRWWLHWTYFLPFYKYALPSNPKNLMYWGIDFTLYTLDLLGISDLLHISWLVFNPESRKITGQEIERLYPYFRDSIRYDRIWIHSNANLGLQKFASAYVLFNCINYCKQISFPVFVHELVHIWQYQNLGSMYIGRSLLAHWEKNPYDFGGVYGIYQGLVAKKKFLSFNFEQQGAIMEHYVRLLPELESAPLLKTAFDYFHLDMLSSEK